MTGAADVAAQIVMPRLSDTMEEGTILRWLKHDGEDVERGEELVEIETDKATMVYESDQAGTLTLIAAEGETLPVGAPIARVGAAASSQEEPGTRAGEGAARQNADGAPPAPEKPQDAARAGASGDGTAGKAATRSPASPSPAPTTGPRGALGRIKASPLARRLARERGVDLETLTGSGPGGRIVRADIPAGNGAGTLTPPSGGSAAAAPAKHAGATAPATGETAPATDESAPATGERVPATGETAPATGETAPAEVSVATAKGQATELPLSRVQQTVARRMAESKATIPDFTMQVEVDMEDCVKLREELKRIAHQPGGSPSEEAAPTYNDMVVKACALALREFPQANASYRDGRIQLYSRINVGVAVAAEASLIVPTVFDAAERSLGEIARETRKLAQRVRDGSITPPELGGGTFTVSNLGMFGVRSFTAIINPPQAAIMSVGSLEPRAVVRGGELVARHTLSLTLVCDHRILYGAEAAGFLARVRELLESPAALTL